MSKLDLRKLPLGEEILQHLREDDWFMEAQSRRVSAELTQLREHMDHFDGKRTVFIREVVSLVAELPQVLARSSGGERASRVKGLSREALQLREGLESAFNTFMRGAYRSLCNEEVQIEDPHLLAFRSAIVDRFRSVIEPDTKACLSVIDTLIDRCKSI